MENVIVVPNIRRNMLKIAVNVYLTFCWLSCFSSPVAAFPCRTHPSLSLDSSLTLDWASVAQSFHSLGVGNFSGCLSAFSRRQLSPTDKVSSSKSTDFCTAASDVLDQLKFKYGLGDSQNESAVAVLLSAYNLHELSAALKINFKLDLSLYPVSFLLCSSLFPCSVGKATYVSCPTICRAGQVVLGNVEPFINASAVPVLRLLRMSLNVCFTETNLNAPHPRPCLSPKGNDSSHGSPGYTISNTTEDSRMQKDGVNAPRFPGYCFNGTCPSPLRATNIRKNWDVKVTALVEKMTKLYKRIFDDDALPVNYSLLPCGRDCISVGFTAEEHDIAHAVLSVCAVVTPLVVAITVVVFYYNRRRLARQFLCRTLLLFTVAGALGGSSYTFAAFSSTRYTCNSDGTLLTHCSSNSQCVFFAGFGHFFCLTALGYFLALSFSWQKLAGSLGKPRNAAVLSRQGARAIYRTDLLCALLIGTPAAVSTIAVSVQHGYDSVPLYGSCVLSLQRGYFTMYYTWYHIGVVLPSAALLGRGIRSLLMTQGLRGTFLWIKGSPHSEKDLDEIEIAYAQAEAASRARWKGAQDLHRLFRLMLFYLVIAFTNVILHSYFGLYLEQNRRDWMAAVERHTLCAITSCNLAKCPSLPDISIATFVIPIAVSSTSVIIISTWVFSRDLLLNVPLVRALFTCLSSQQIANTDQDQDQKGGHLSLGTNPDNGESVSMSAVYKTSDEQRLIKVRLV